MADWIAILSKQRIHRKACYHRHPTGKEWFFIRQQDNRHEWHQYWFLMNLYTHELLVNHFHSSATSRYDIKQDHVSGLLDMLSCTNPEHRYWRRTENEVGDSVEFGHMLRKWCSWRDWVGQESFEPTPALIRFRFSGRTGGIVFYHRMWSLDLLACSSFILPPAVRPEQ